MSSPEGTGTFVEANSCSPCPAGTKVTLATSVPNDETRCMLAGVYAKMPDGCKGKNYAVRSCYPKKAVDDFLQDYRDDSGNVVSKPSTAGTKSEVLSTYGPMKDWDMSLVTDLSYLFFRKGTLDEDLSNWDVSGVTNMQGSTYQPISILFLYLFF